MYGVSYPIKRGKFYPETELNFGKPDAGK